MKRVLAYAAACMLCTIAAAPGGPLGALGGAWFGGCIGSCLEGIAIGFGWE